MKNKIWQVFNDERAFEVPEPDMGIIPITQDETDAIVEYDDMFLKKFTYNTNAIEGSTLTFGDTELVLDGEFPMDPENKQLKDVFAAIGVRDGVNLAQQFLERGRAVDEEFVKDLHQATALDCQPRTRGVYRVIPVYIKNSLTVPVSPERVREFMADLMYGYQASSQHPIVKSAGFHVLFENIHPFRDGNGRTGRIVLNYMLQQAGYPPIALKSANRQGYLSSLERWQVHGDPEPFIKLIVEQIHEETDARKDALKLTRLAVKNR